LATGTLLTVDNQIDTTTGTVKLRAIFANKDFALFPNQFVNARLLVDTLRDVTLVPNAAIQRNAQGAYLYVIKPDQTATIRQVKESTTDGTKTAVQGVEAGEVVATDGFDKLQENAKVRARGTGSSAGAGSGAGAAPPASAAPGASGTSKEAVKR